MVFLDDLIPSSNIWSGFDLDGWTWSQGFNIRPEGKYIHCFTKISQVPKMEGSVALHIEYLYFRYLKCLVIAETSKNQECRAHNANSKIRTHAMPNPKSFGYMALDQALFFSITCLCATTFLDFKYLDSKYNTYNSWISLHSWDNNTYKGAILIFTIS